MAITLDDIISDYMRAKGSKGGTARAKSLSKKRIREIALKASAAAKAARLKKKTAA